MSKVDRGAVLDMSVPIANIDDRVKAQGHGRRKWQVQAAKVGL